MKTREPGPDLLADLERAVADPDTRDPAALRIRDLRGLAAEGSAGGVTATVDGYLRLKAIRIPPEAIADLPRLGRSVRRAINLAINESERRQPPVPPFDRFSLEPYRVPPSRPPTPAAYGGVVTPEEALPWRGYLPAVDEARRAAFIDAAHVVRERIRRDAEKVEGGLADLLLTVYLYLGRPRLHAAWVRRVAGVDAKHLWWFRVQVGVSLTGYIRHRRLETAARMICRSELTLEEIAPLFDFPSARGLSKAIRAWSGQSPDHLRWAWEYVGLDYVLLRWAVHGDATAGQAERVVEDLERVRERIVLPLVE